MAKVDIKPYIGTKMILLAFNWEDGKNKANFLGFAIKRSPGFNHQIESWLPNRISFDGPKKGVEFSTDKFPIQKFMWWDNRLNYENKDIEYTYTVIPVTGNKDNPILENISSNTVKVKLLPDVKNGIGTYFNRAVVSSQAFSQKFPNGINENNKQAAFEWLADGLEKVVPGFIENATSIEGAIYHLEDTYWILPAFENTSKSVSLVIDRAKLTGKTPDLTNDNAIKMLGNKPNIALIPRKHTSIMHNKFLVNVNGNNAQSVLMGSANFTTDGLTQQANYLHTIECPELAELYLQRKRLLNNDPERSQINKDADWSQIINFNGASIRVFFPPEYKPPKSSGEEPERKAMTPIIEAIKSAQYSVIFSLFSPTDEELRDAIFNKADEGKMMFGLINEISDTEPKDESDRADAKTKVEIYHRSKDKKDVYGHKNYSKDTVPDGFWWETSGIGAKKYPVFIHHKFILIDGETDHPILYTGSANMSNNSNYNNDENILEIRDATDLSCIYFAEFMRLYEHYRARTQWDDFVKKGDQSTYKLTNNSDWAKDDYTEGNPKYKTRLIMVGKKDILG